MENPTNINLFNKKAPSWMSPEDEENLAQKQEQIANIKEALAILQTAHNHFGKTTKTLVENNIPALFIDFKDLVDSSEVPLTERLTPNHNPNGFQIAVADSHGVIDESIALIAQFKPDEAELVRFKAAAMAQDLTEANNEHNSTAEQNRPDPAPTAG